MCIQCDDEDLCVSFFFFFFPFAVAVAVVAVVAAAAADDAPRFMLLRSATHFHLQYTCEVSSNSVPPTTLPIMYNSAILLPWLA